MHITLAAHIAASIPPRLHSPDMPCTAERGAAAPGGKRHTALLRAHCAHRSRCPPQAHGPITSRHHRDIRRFRPTHGAESPRESRVALNPSRIEPESQPVPVGCRKIATCMSSENVACEKLPAKPRAKLTELCVRLTPHYFLIWMNLVMIGNFLDSTL